MQWKHCSGRCLSGQTHAVYTEGGQHNYVGTARLGRTDFEFSGGIVHEVLTLTLTPNRITLTLTLTLTLTRCAALLLEHGFDCNATNRYLQVR